MFPLFLLQRSDMLRHIVEWQAPSYSSLWQKFFLVQIALAVLVLAKRPSWRLALPFAVFVPAALYSSRNLLVASLVLTATMAPALKGLGELKADARLSSRPLAWAGAFTLAARGGADRRLGRPASRPSQLASYPVQALAFAEANRLVPPADGSEGRLLTQDFVGNFREYLDGPIGDVFVDDRAEVLDKKSRRTTSGCSGSRPTGRPHSTGTTSTPSSGSATCPSRWCWRSHPTGRSATPIRSGSWRPAAPRQLASRELPGGG